MLREIFFFQSVFVSRFDKFDSSVCVGFGDDDDGDDDEFGNSAYTYCCSVLWIMYRGKEPY
jgi:hypothetical protein